MRCAGERTKQQARRARGQRERGGGEGGGKAIKGGRAASTLGKAGSRLPVARLRGGGQQSGQKGQRGAGVTLADHSPRVKSLNFEAMLKFLGANCTSRLSKLWKLPCALRSRRSRRSSSSTAMHPSPRPPRPHSTRRRRRRHDMHDPLFKSQVYSNNISVTFSDHNFSCKLATDIR